MNFRREPVSITKVTEGVTLRWHTELYRYPESNFNLQQREVIKPYMLPCKHAVKELPTGSLSRFNASNCVSGKVKKKTKKKQGTCWSKHEYILVIAQKLHIHLFIYAVLLTTEEYFISSFMHGSLLWMLYLTGSIWESHLFCDIKCTSILKYTKELALEKMQTS